jgi:DNA gyrase subunit A
MTDIIESTNDSNLESIALNTIAERKFLEYSMYVIVDRALPDIRDGLKPVHRRTLFAQYKLNNYYNKPYKKSARVVGDVIGKYHPHGDTAVYDSLVRMAQPFSLRANLIDGQGNFGSVDGDSPAAMRYTECRQSIFANSMFEDIDKETVKMIENYDGSELMPDVLPTRFPNLLVNGSQGIAVGMASYVPTHNPIEVLECVNYLLNSRFTNTEVILEDLMNILPAPDFPTGGIVHDLSQMENAWLNGRGKVKLRAKWYEEELESGRNALIITEIPYQVKKEDLIDSIIKLANPNKEKGGKIEIDDIYDISDESTKDIRIVIELKKDAEAEIVFNSLLKKTRLEVSISYNNTVLVNKEPKVVGILEILNNFIDFRDEVITNRTIFLNKKAQRRMYLLEGFYTALKQIDQVIELIKKSKTPSDAVVSLISFLNIEEEQARNIIEMKLSRLTSSQVDEIISELEELKIKVARYEEILGSKEERLKIIQEETESQIDLFANTKLDNYISTFSYGKRMSDISYELIKNDLASLTKEEECTIIYSKDGYIRRMPVDEMESQNRGTRGKKHIILQKKDFILQSIYSHSHSSLLIISEKGKVFGLHAYEIPDIDKGRHIKNIIELPENENILMIVPVDFSTPDQFLTMITKKGNVKKSRLSAYANSFRKSGLIGINLNENDSVIYCSSCKENDDLVLVNSDNLIIRFKIDESIRTLSRSSKGVRGMTLRENSNVIGGAVVSDNKNTHLACITESGMVKITRMDEYKVQRRSGKGLKSFKESERTGKLFKALVISDLNSDLITTTKNGISNRISIDNINITRRTTSGVKLIKIDSNDSIADVFNSDKLTEEE